MGNAESVSAHGGYDDSHDDPYDPFEGADTLGYRVLGVQPNSPKSCLPLTDNSLPQTFNATKHSTHRTKDKIASLLSLDKRKFLA